MSISTLIGVLVGFGLFLGAIAISTDNYIVFLSVPSLVIVLGGTMAAAFISFEARYVMQELRALGEIFKAPSSRLVMTPERLLPSSSRSRTSDAQHKSTSDGRL